LRQTDRDDRRGKHIRHHARIRCSRSAAADRLADAVELELKGELKDPNDMFDALYAYREATK
jgi:hypothetical protein